MTRNQMLDDLCVLFGGIEAERLMLADISTGAGGSDLYRGTILAHLIVETYGMGDNTGLRQYRSPRDGKRLDGLSEEQMTLIDRAVTAIITQAQTRAAALLSEHKAELIALRDEVIAKKTIEAKGLTRFQKKPAADAAAPETTRNG
jgi:cell division protease FtsH